VRLAQIVGNLLHNAVEIHAAPGGKVTLQARVEGRRQSGASACSDNGIGIPGQTNSNTMFGLFSPRTSILHRPRAGRAGHRPVAGAQAGRAAWRHRYRSAARAKAMAVLSKCSLPVHVRRGRCPCTVGKRSAGPGQTPAGGYRILVVDDSVDSASHAVRAAGNQRPHRRHQPYRQGTRLPRQRSFNPEIVFLDIGLPDMTGYEVAARPCAACPKLTGVKLVALTGYGQEKDKHDARAAGFDHHLVKPINFDALTALTSKHL
jgi:CheY-like chemotaxis protein